MEIEKLEHWYYLLCRSGEGTKVQVRNEIRAELERLRESKTEILPGEKEK